MLNVLKVKVQKIVKNAKKLYWRENLQHVHGTITFHKVRSQSLEAFSWILKKAINVEIVTLYPFGHPVSSYQRCYIWSLFKAFFI